MFTVLLHVDYSEPDPATYRSCYLEYGNDYMRTPKGTITVASGNPVNDYRMILRIASGLFGEDSIILKSSDVDHFVFDGGELLGET